MQAEDGIRDLVRSRGLGDVYKRQVYTGADLVEAGVKPLPGVAGFVRPDGSEPASPLRRPLTCLLYTSDAADDDLVSISVVAVSLKKKKEE